MALSPANNTVLMSSFSLNQNDRKTIPLNNFTILPPPSPMRESACADGESVCAGEHRTLSAVKLNREILILFLKVETKCD